MLALHVVGLCSCHAAVGILHIHDSTAKSLQAEVI